MAGNSRTNLKVLEAWLDNRGRNPLWLSRTFTKAGTKSFIERSLVFIFGNNDSGSVQEINFQSFPIGIRHKDPLPKLPTVCPYVEAPTG